jgi:hypothetical protein
MLDFNTTISRGGACVVSDLPRDGLSRIACKRCGRTGTAIFFVLVLSIAALSACKQADPNFDPNKEFSFDGGK